MIQIKSNQMGWNIEVTNIPSTNPTTPLMRSKILLIRSPARLKTDWMVEKRVLKMPATISKSEEKRLEMPFVREDMVVVVAWLG